MFPLTPDQHHWLDVATEDEGWCSFRSCTRQYLPVSRNIRLCTTLCSSTECSLLCTLYTQRHCTIHSTLCLYYFHDTSILRPIGWSQKSSKAWDRTKVDDVGLLHYNISLVVKKHRVYVTCNVLLAPVWFRCQFIGCTCQSTVNSTYHIFTQHFRKTELCRCKWPWSTLKVISVVFVWM